MTEKIVHSIKSQEDAAQMIRDLALDGTNWIVKVERQSKRRSLDQNALSHQWYADIARQREDMTVSEIRAECKLTCGVPILRRDNEKFRETYDRCLADRSYEAQMEFIEFTELPVTRLMSKKQLSEYMDKISAICRSRGIVLTHPDDQQRRW